MQAAKDSFFRALQSRLATVNPTRTITLDGVVRPAILVVENEPYPPPKLFFNTFYIHWLGAPRVREFSGTLAPRYSLTAQTEYFVQGAASLQRPFADRGRLLAQLDGELIEVLFPGATQKMDYSTMPPTDLGSQLLWNWTPGFQTMADGGILRRLTTVNVSFFLETIPN
ncbi:MAG TPA: hypothetical protein VGQ11_00260 [Candidatus Acidoferrales bacterium]|jgi:hypothetical protein|nr:hypothetical protein [Candidatus Acidoferrales bacterium]